MIDRYRICASCGKARKLSYGVNKAKLTPFCYKCATQIIKDKGLLAYHQLRERAKLIIENHDPDDTRR